MDGELNRTGPHNGSDKIAPHRQRLPPRRQSITEMIVVDNASVTATIGFDEVGAPKEIFLGGKTGSAMDLLLADAAVAQRCASIRYST